MQMVELISEPVIAICLSVKASAGRRPAVFALSYFDWLDTWMGFLHRLTPCKCKEANADM